jgi:ribosomal protein S18 acetylase RimI-like enzyme
MREIRAWPRYRPPYEALDYALRRGGWLDSFARIPGCLALGGHLEQRLVGFSLLIPKGGRRAEFYVAIKGDRLARGLGGAICVETLRIGFRRNGLRNIFLIVRTNHATGIRLYRKIGFVTTGRTIETTNRIPTRFLVMEITRERFRYRHGGRRLRSS